MHHDWDVDTQRTCTIDGCDRPYRASGFCGRHYSRWRVHGDPLYERQWPQYPDECTVEDCDEPHQFKGFCSHHYIEDRAARRRSTMGGCSVEGCDGDPYIVGPPVYCRTHYRRLKARGGTFGRAGDQGDIVDRLDAQSVGVRGGCIEWTSRPNTPDGKYGRVRWGDPDPTTGRKKYHLAHRVAWALWNDVDAADLPTEGVIRHLCGNARCINPLHLEHGTHSQNTHDAVRAGQHVTRKLSRLMGKRLRDAALRRGVSEAIIDDIIAELS